MARIVKSVGKDDVSELIPLVVALEYSVNMFSDSVHRLLEESELVLMCCEVRDEVYGREMKDWVFQMAMVVFVFCFVMFFSRRCFSSVGRKLYERGGGL
jgi:hypothetical protein